MSAHHRIAVASDLGVLATLRRGLALSPEMITGIWVTLLLAVLAAAGRVVVPVTVQQAVDTGILADGGPDAARVTTLVLVAAVMIVLAGTCTALVNVRLFRSTETGLANLRTRAFRHVHDLSMLTQGTERRGALVSRVTSDVDTISFFVQWGGIMLLVSVLQVGVATVLMAVYSWQLAIVVWLVFVPLFFVLRPAQKRVNRAYGAQRERVGAMLGAISESVVGAETIRAYGAQRRTARRVDVAVERTRRAMVRAQALVSVVFSSGVLVANLVLAVVVVVGTYLGIAGEITVGQLLAFLFLVQLFTGPVQMATEILNELQNAVAGWRRVIAIIDTPVSVVDAGERGVPSPRGPAHVELDGVRFAYPDGPEVLHGVDLDLPARASVAVVGRTGSGKTTIAKLVTRLMDPTAGRVLLDGTDVRDVSLARLRERVVLVPQEGFLFDGTLLDNMVYGLPPGFDGDARAAAVDAVDVLGLTDWVAGLARGLDSSVGQRGEGLSAGERQLVALVRAYLAGGDLLVLDEATSAVDPATEVRIARALDSLTAGRTTITIAHRMSTAEAADVVVVVDEGHVVETGPHDELVAAGGVYAQMHDSWVAQTR
ncbi:ABC-type multidrug transport system fused ATPase/permease subunit [Sediminihabitans luteus]|uniref:ABC-type multidrug transport system fused ATPase/permease subunit n=1 Tax=Sediminihabitans luteus TaxID=1138585 RepID=A0A2M9CQY9_9CELL|nr:ABC transporter ATP-binding protein [Sediminihabitans luteus]PJJ74350.1 ABC-type multidrug transport system fused ATPase/permease subunit [Sediminihabitans luteus]GIJ00462.1 multidrug ABC transporter ATP-binding protein [Sediminihabitans luteus]